MSTQQPKAPFEYQISPGRDRISITLGPTEMRLTPDQLQALGMWMLELRGQMDPPPPPRPDATIRPLPASELYVSQYRGRLPTQAGCNILFKSSSLGYFNFPASADVCKRIVNELTTVLLPNS
jgi:hypothetical protein